MMAKSLSGDAFMQYWTQVQQLVTLPVPGSVEDLPPHFLESYMLLRSTLAHCFEGDASPFWDSAFDARTYARLMGTLRLNSFTIVSPDARALVTAVGQDATEERRVEGGLLPAGAEERCGGEAAPVTSCGSDDMCSTSHYREAGGGTALFPVASLLNHSCSPCCDVVMYPAGRVAVRARRDLGAGTELTTTYVDESLNNAKRRSVLLHSYGFACDCERCAAGQ